MTPASHFLICNMYAISNEWEWMIYFDQLFIGNSKNLYVKCTGFAAFISSKAQKSCTVLNPSSMPSFSK